jgi:hypothetical protein
MIATQTLTIEVVDSLALLTHKVASNVFDLSSGLHHVSIRDQIVRAQLLVRDLCRGDPTCKTILIVGAGVAGIAAAMEAQALGKQAVVLETQQQPFGLFRGVFSRHVGPFMYEWPSPFHGDQTYPPTASDQWGATSPQTPSWASAKPLPANKLAQQLLQWLNSKAPQFQTGALSLRVGVSAHAVRTFVKIFAQTQAARSLARLRRQAPMPAASLTVSAWPSWPPHAQAVANAPGAVTPDYVLLAAGMGSENVNLLPPSAQTNFRGAAFWANDTLLTRPPNENFITAVFGGGDGALQDVLRLLTAYNHPLEFLAFLEGDAKVKRELENIMPSILSVDRQSRLYSTWTQQPDAYAQVDEACRQIAHKLAKHQGVRLRVGQKLGEDKSQGRGKVLHYVRASCFDKAYLLNRFLVHLINQCKLHPDESANWRQRYALHFDRQATAYWPNGKRHEFHITDHANNDHGKIDADHIVVRYGIEKGSVPGAQMIQISPRQSHQRTTLARVELPFIAQT